MLAPTKNEGKQGKFWFRLEPAQFLNRKILWAKNKVKIIRIVIPLRMLTTSWNTKTEDQS